eukprot:PhF_6_TR37449/c0_g1_i3/m.55060
MKSIMRKYSVDSRLARRRKNFNESSDAMWKTSNTKADRKLSSEKTNSPASAEKNWLCLRYYRARIRKTLTIGDTDADEVSFSTHSQAVETCTLRRKTQIVLQGVDSGFLSASPSPT